MKIKNKYLLIILTLFLFFLVSCNSKKLPERNIEENIVVEKVEENNENIEKENKEESSKSEKVEETIVEEKKEKEITVEESTEETKTIENTEEKAEENNKIKTKTKLVYSGTKKLPYIALTFDDGLSVENIRSIMDTLDNYGVKSTFFFIGSFIEQEPELIREMVRRGHEIANHSYDHPDLTKKSYEFAKDNIERTSKIYKKIVGEDMVPYFRPPYGAKNSETLRALSDLGYTHAVLWNIDTEDWQGKSPEYISNHVIETAANGNIVLMHTTKSSYTYKALPKMIEGLHKKGYTLVKMSDMLNEVENIKNEK